MAKEENMVATVDGFRKTNLVETFRAGHVIFLEGQPGHVMYVIQQGEVEIRIRGHIVETLGPGDIFGELALIDDAPRNATAIARTDSRVIPIDQKRFAFLVQQTPYFALKLMQTISQRLRDIHSIWARLSDNSQCG